MADIDASLVTKQRARAAVLVALLHLLLGYGLVAGLGVDFVRTVERRLKLFAIAPDPPPPPPPVTVPAPVRIPEPEGAAAPPSLRSRPSPVVAPREGRRSPVRAARRPEPLPTGSAARGGASATPGEGGGAGGQGSGAGAGRGGSGTGGGGRPTRARRISGSISGTEDYFRAARRRGFSGTVSVRFTVTPAGLVTGCRVTRSSGDAAIDATTCRLVEQRFRYRPATDVEGRPVQDTASATFDYQWLPATRRAD
jgi:protein TonB